MEKIIAKVQKLLELAGNNPNENEAQAAMLKAQQLMARYHIEAAQVTKKEEVKKVETTIIEGNQSTAWAIRLANIITANFRCNLLRVPGKGLMFVGLVEDVAIARGVYVFAVQVLEKNMKKLRRQYRKQGLSTDGISQDYAAGFLAGLKKKYDDQVKENEWALVLVKDALVVAETQALISPNRKAYQAKEKARRGDANLYAMGYHDGNTLGDNQKALEGAVS